MSYRLDHYRPSFFSGFEDVAPAWVSAPSDLRRVPWVEAWAKSPEFFRFSYAARNRYSRRDPKPDEGGYLMAELNGGKNSWVVGIFESDPKDIALPIWSEPRKGRE